MNLFKKFTKTNLLDLEHKIGIAFFALFAIVGLPVTVVAVNHAQDVRSHAQELAKNVLQIGSFSPSNYMDQVALPHVANEIVVRYNNTVTIRTGDGVDPKTSFKPTDITSGLTKKALDNLKAANVVAMEKLYPNLPQYQVYKNTYVANVYKVTVKANSDLGVSMQAFCEDTESIVYCEPNYTFSPASGASDKKPTKVTAQSDTQIDTTTPIRDRKGQPSELIGLIDVPLPQNYPQLVDALKLKPFNSSNILPNIESQRTDKYASQAVFSAGAIQFVNPDAKILFEGVCGNNCANSSISKGIVDAVNRGAKVIIVNELAFFPKKITPMNLVSAIDYAYSQGAIVTTAEASSTSPLGMQTKPVPTNFIDKIFSFAQNLTGFPPQVLADTPTSSTLKSTTGYQYLTPNGYISCSSPTTCPGVSQTNLNNLFRCNGTDCYQESTGNVAGADGVPNAALGQRGHLQPSVCQSTGGTTGCTDGSYTIPSSCFGSGTVSGSAGGVSGSISGGSSSGSCFTNDPLGPPTGVNSTSTNPLPIAPLPPGAVQTQPAVTTTTSGAAITLPKDLSVSSYNSYLTQQGSGITGDASDLLKTMAANSGSTNLSSIPVAGNGSAYSVVHALCPNCSGAQINAVLSKPDVLTLQDAANALSGVVPANAINPATGTVNNPTQLPQPPAAPAATAANTAPVAPAAGQSPETAAVKNVVSTGKGADGLDIMDPKSTVVSINGRNAYEINNGLLADGKTHDPAAWTTDPKTGQQVPAVDPTTKQPITYDSELERASFLPNASLTDVQTALAKQGFSDSNKVLSIIADPKVYPTVNSAVSNPIYQGLTQDPTFQGLVQKYGQGVLDLVETKDFQDAITGPKASVAGALSYIQSKASTGTLASGSSGTTGSDAKKSVDDGRPITAADANSDLQQAYYYYQKGLDTQCAAKDTKCADEKATDLSNLDTAVRNYDQFNTGSKSITLDNVESGAKDGTKTVPGTNLIGTDNPNSKAAASFNSTTANGSSFGINCTSSDGCDPCSDGGKVVSMSDNNGKQHAMTDCGGTGTGTDSGTNIDTNYPLISTQYAGCPGPSCADPDGYNAYLQSQTTSQISTIATELGCGQGDNGTVCPDDDTQARFNAAAGQIYGSTPPPQISADGQAQIIAATTGEECILSGNTDCGSTDDGSAPGPIYNGVPSYDTPPPCPDCTSNGDGTYTENSTGNTFNPDTGTTTDPNGNPVFDGPPVPVADAITATTQAIGDAAVPTLCDDCNSTSSDAAAYPADAVANIAATLSYPPPPPPPTAIDPMQGFNPSDFPDCGDDCGGT